MSKQGANFTVFERTLTKISGMHFQTFGKFYGTLHSRSRRGGRGGTCPPTFFQRKILKI